MMDYTLLEYYKRTVAECFMDCDGDCSLCIDGNCKCVSGNVLEHLERLKAYEDAEEQGLLLRLPCPIGSEVWKIVNQRDNFSDELHKIVTRVNFRLNMLSEIGKTVFLTNEEVEQALEEMKGGAE